MSKKFQYIGAPEGRGFPDFCYISNTDGAWVDGTEWNYGYGTIRLVYSTAVAGQDGYAVFVDHKSGWSCPDNG